MVVKYQFGKNWSWCTEPSPASNSALPRITERQVEIVYRLDSPQCSFGSCKYQNNRDFFFKL